MKDSNSSNSNKNEFSFLKLRDEIQKLGVNQGIIGSGKDDQAGKKLKFEPNVNVTRNQSKFYCKNSFFIRKRKNVGRKKASGGGCS
jgi:hypothetical protein